MTKIKWQWVKRTQKLLENAKKKVRAEVEAKIDQSADEVLALQRSLAPRDQGDYVNSFDKVGDGLRREVGPNPDKLKAAGHPANLPIWLNFGTSKMRARPHIFLAARALRRKFQARITRAVRKGLKLK